MYECMYLYNNVCIYVYTYMSPDGDDLHNVVV